MANLFSPVLLSVASVDDAAALDIVSETDRFELPDVNTQSTHGGDPP